MFDFDLGFGIKSILQVAVSIVQAVAKIITDLAKKLGIIEADDPEPEELGDKAIQFEEETGLGMEDFDSPKEYYEKVKEFEVDETKSVQIEQKDKLSKAIEINAALLEQKYPDIPMGELFEMIGSKREYFNETRIDYIGRAIVENESIVADIVDFSKNDIKDTDRFQAVFDSLSDIERSIDPDITPEQIEINVDKLSK